MKVIGYVRVSTRRQGESGLGLEAQREAIRSWVERNGATMVETYTEVESGRLADRPQLQAALAHARRSKAVLLIAKWDRLSRNLAFIANLMESKVDFVAVDNPHANRLTIHILAAVAEDEARRISERTKAALAAAKARGVKLGSARPDHWAGREKARKAGLKAATAKAAEANRAIAAAAYADLLPEMLRLRSEGKTLADIADELNAQGHTTRRGSAWSPTAIMRVLDRS